MTKDQIEQLLQKYWAAQTNRNEEKLLFEYFLSDQVLTEYRQLIPLFKVLSTKKKTNIDPKFDHNYWTQKAESIPNKTNTPVFQLKKWSIAASLALLLGFAAWFTQYQTQQKQTAQLNDPQIALEESEMAIRYLVGKFSKGQHATQSVNYLKTINIFNTKSNQ